MRKLAVNARMAWATKPKQPGTTLRERIVEEPVPSPLEDFADLGGEVRVVLAAERRVVMMASTRRIAPHSHVKMSTP